MPANYQNKFCQNCPYCNAKHLPSYLQGLPLNSEIRKTKTLLVFQSPGINEWTGNSGEDKPAPLISNSSTSTAARLRKSFCRIHKKRTDFDITETVQCYPGQYSNKRDKKPRIAAINQCSHHLAKDIQENTYSKIISFGVFANNIVDEIIKKQNITVQHIKLPHPSSGKLSNLVLDANLK